MYTEYEKWRDSFYVGGENEDVLEKREKYYAESRERYNNAIEQGYYISSYGIGCHESCNGCKHLHDIGMRLETDDLELMYCDNKECRYHKIARLETTIQINIMQLMQDVGDDEFRIIGIKLYGSYLTESETSASDIDILVEYEGTMREDDAFNMLHETPMYYDNRIVDINPIKAEKSGTTEEYLARTGHKCNWNDCPFNKNNRCVQKDGGGIKYGMDATGRFHHERQSEEVKLHCRNCMPDLGQINNK